MTDTEIPTPPLTYLTLSPTVGKIAAALGKAQSTIKSPAKDRTVTVRTKSGSTYQFKYATLDAVNHAIREPLAANGFAITQALTVHEKFKGPALSTILLHSSGEWIQSTAQLMVSESTSQAQGSAISYMRRYQICAILNIVADEDDDANAADGNTIETSSTASVSKATRGVATGTFKDDHHRPDNGTFEPETLYTGTIQQFRHPSGKRPGMVGVETKLGVLDVSFPSWAVPPDIKNTPEEELIGKRVSMSYVEKPNPKGGGPFKNVSGFEVLAS